MKRNAGILLIGAGFVAGILLGILALRLLSSRTPAPPEAATLPEEGKTSPVVGSRAPDFTLATLDGESIHLEALRGRPVLLNFWASWCGPCELEMPDIQARADRWEGQLFVLGINYDEPQTDAQAFVDRMGITFPILLDEGKRVSRQYLVQGLPTTVILDSGGVVRIRHVGLLTGDQLDQYLTEVGLVP